jgi:hypothetical protein
MKCSGDFENQGTSDTITLHIEFSGSYISQLDTYAEVCSACNDPGRLLARGAAIAASWNRVLEKTGISAKAYLGRIRLSMRSKYELMKGGDLESFIGHIDDIINDFENLTELRDTRPLIILTTLKKMLLRSPNTANASMITRYFRDQAPYLADAYRRSEKERVLFNEVPTSNWPLWEQMIANREDVAHGRHMLRCPSF